MSLREQLASEQAALEHDRLAPVRQQISELETTRQQLVDLQNQVGPDLESFLAQTEKLKGTSKVIDDLRTEFAEALAQRGIKSRAELLANPEFAEEAEIAGFHQARTETAQSAEQVRATAGKIKDAISDLMAKTGPKSRKNGEKNLPQAWAGRVRDEIQARVQAIDGQLLELRLQTPEGQEAARTAYREELGKRRASGLSRSDLTDSNMREVRDFVNQSHLADASRFGRSIVQEVILEQAQSQIREEVQRKAAQFPSRIAILQERLAAYAAARLHMDWAREERDEFTRDHRDADWEMIYKAQQRALGRAKELISRTIPELRANQQQWLATPIVLHMNRYRGEEYGADYDVSMPELEERVADVENSLIPEIAQRVKQLEADIRHQTQVRDSTTLGVGKSRRAKAEIQEVIDQKQAELASERAALNRLVTEVQSIKRSWNMSRLLNELSRVRVHDDYLGHPIPLGEFLDELPEAIKRGATNIELKPEQEHLVEQYGRLAESLQAAQDDYEKFKIS